MPSDQWTPWKRRLTQAKKKGHMAVIDCWRDFEVFCEINGWPDWWADVQRAADDARFAIQNGSSFTSKGVF